jgi:hypothetical protein
VGASDEEDRDICKKMIRYWLECLVILILKMAQRSYIIDNDIELLTPPAKKVHCVDDKGQHYGVYSEIHTYGDTSKSNMLFDKFMEMQIENARLREEIKAIKEQQASNKCELIVTTSGQIGFAHQNRICGFYKDQILQFIEKNQDSLL